MQTWDREGRECRECGGRSPRGARFCGQCGVRIPPHCGACGWPGAPAARFCGQCGRALALDSAVAGRSARRPLSLMFCDLVGSTQLAAQLGAETYGEVVGAYQASAAAAIERRGGYVAQHQGDGLLVYFGWPQAGDDDAERAVRAGLDVLESLDVVRAELRATHGIALDVRLALHTGTVVVGEVGVGSRREMLALGDEASLAAQLQALAPINGLLISDATLARVRGRFETRPLGEAALRGFARPVRIHQVLRGSARRPVARATPLVTAAVERSRVRAG